MAKVETREFVCIQGDGVAEQALRRLAGITHFPTRVLGEGDEAGPESIALLFFDPHVPRNGSSPLRHGFSGRCLRIAPEDRVKREYLPPCIKEAGHLVFVKRADEDVGITEALTNVASTFSALPVVSL